jgi:alcohol dehydrogenase class IV
MTERAWSQTSVAQEVRFGAGVTTELPTVLRGLGLRRVLLVTSAGRLASDAGERVVRALGHTLVSTAASVEPHLPADTVRAVLADAQALGVDGLVTLGGGSVVDAGKAVSFFVERQEGTPGRGALDRPALPHVALPSTYCPGVLAGTFTMTDPHTRTKGVAGSTTTTPAAVLFDPDLLADLGPATAAGTALDALGAAMEGAWAIGRAPETEALALAASQRIAGVLPLVIDTPDDDVVRADLLEGVVLAARVLQQTGPGPHQALAQLLGGRSGAPHGVLSAILLPHVARWQAQGDPVAFDRLEEALGGPPDLAVSELLERTGLPDRLGALGLPLDDLDAVARLSQAHPGLARARPPMREDEVRGLLAEAW